MTPRGLRARFGRLSTSVKLFAILSLALLPLGLVALFASIHSSRNANAEQQAMARSSLAENARQLDAAFATDTAAMRVATSAIALGGSPAETCERLAAQIALHRERVPQFALFGLGEAPICANTASLATRPSTAAVELGARTVVDAESVSLIIPGRNGDSVVVARYPATTLLGFMRLDRVAEGGSLGLANADNFLSLKVPRDAVAVAITRITVPVGPTGLSLILTEPERGFGLTETVLAFMPFVMWISAAGVTFLLVDRLLIRPLRQLREAVDNNRIGQPLAIETARSPAREIRELGDEIGKAFAEQLRATREVHHRVKNNLQIIASLISLHARTAKTPDAAAAYADIRRRVDALAIVHRSHYAELDTGGLIELRRLIGEIAANLRAGVEGKDTPPAISLGGPPLLVVQDVAIAVAFLLTELVELSVLTDARAVITVTTAFGAESDKGSVTVAMPAFASSDPFEARLASDYARVIEGLGRQLRSPVIRDIAVQSFCVAFAAERGVQEISGQDRNFSGTDFEDARFTN